jgi:hypothetical protein
MLQGGKEDAQRRTVSCCKATTLVPAPSRPCGEVTEMPSGSVHHGDQLDERCLDLHSQEMQERPDNI